MSRQLKFKDEYRIFRNHGFRPLKAAMRAWGNVQLSKNIDRKNNKKGGTHRG